MLTVQNYERIRRAYYVEQMESKPLAIAPQGLLMGTFAMT